MICSGPHAFWMRREIHEEEILCPNHRVEAGLEPRSRVTLSGVLCPHQSWTDPHVTQDVSSELCASVQQEALFFLTVQR